MKVLLNTAYWPNADYMVSVLRGDQIFIEAHEHYQKQSYRNRCSILGANGKQDLIIPVIHHKHKQFVHEVQISYQTNWQHQHWGAIQSAYGKTPYFEYFSEDLRLFYSKKFDHLFDYNTAILKTTLKILRSGRKINITSAYEPSVPGVLDLRDKIHPKNDDWSRGENAGVLNRPYQQAFSDKHGFNGNLSILDLLFNQGLGSLDYLELSNPY